MASHDHHVTFFDIPTKAPRKCSSPNTWKTRALLNYKGIPYDTVWLEYPEIEPTLKSFGLAENAIDRASGTYTKYWCPVVKLPDGTYVMESHDIAVALEKLQPEPAVHVDSEHSKHAESIVGGIQRTLVPAYLYRLPDDNFTPTSREWYHRQRGALFGKDLYEVAKMQPWSGETPWQNAKELFNKLAALLHKDESGPFIAGTKPLYADFIVVGLFKSMRLMDREGDFHGRVMSMDAAFPRLEEACSKWFERDSY